MAEDVLSMPDVTNLVLENFQDPKFCYEVETFVNLHIPDFAVATTDGSHPLSWTMLHKKYKNLYEGQLQRCLQQCGSEVTEFMDYLSACNDAYSGDPNFQALLTALTASQ
ncbi:unnamed protein product, partial [Polarella glacialis]